MVDFSLGLLRPERMALFYSVRLISEKMMQINFYATLRPIVGAKTVDIALEEGATVQQLINTVVEHYPPLREQLLDEAGNLHRHVHVFINGRDAPYLADAFKTPLSVDDTIDIFPAVAGG